MFKNTVVSRVTIVATIVAMALASISATSVFAAGPTKSSPASPEAVAAILQKDLKFETLVFKSESAIFNHIDRSLDNSSSTRKIHDRDTAGQTRAERSRTFITVDDILNKAQALLKSHAGFDAANNVTDQAQAQKTVDQMRIYLNELRDGLLTRLENLLS